MRAKIAIYVKALMDAYPGHYSNNAIDGNRMHMQLEC